MSILDTNDEVGQTNHQWSVPYSYIEILFYDLLRFSAHSGLNKYLETFRENPNNYGYDTSASLKIINSIKNKSLCMYLYV